MLLRGGGLREPATDSEPAEMAAAGHEDDNDDDDDDDDAAASSTGSREDEDALAVAAVDTPCPGVFENIVIKNSTNVQFGNNSYYQGPVTIKQIVYHEPEDALCIGPGACDGGRENRAFVIDKEVESKHAATVAAADPAGLGTGTAGGRFKCRWAAAATAAAVTALLLTLTTVLLVTRQYHTASTAGGGDGDDEQLHSTPIDPPIDPDANYTLSGKLRIVPRLEWVAQPPAHPLDPLRVPVPYVIVLHTATENCSDQATCVYHVRYIQTFHLESKNWWDIAYNFLVGGDGNAYEGRGWTAEGANAFGYNNRCIGIAFIGTFNSLRPPQRQIRAAKQLIALGVKLGYIARDYKLLAHRQVSSTQSPGEELYRDLKTWPHWARAP